MLLPASYLYPWKWGWWWMSFSKLWQRSAFASNGLLRLSAGRYLPWRSGRKFYWEVTPRYIILPESLWLRERWWKILSGKCHAGHSALHNDRPFSLFVSAVPPVKYPLRLSPTSRWWEGWWSPYIRVLPLFYSSCAYSVRWWLAIIWILNAIFPVRLLSEYLLPPYWTEILD